MNPFLRVWRSLPGLSSTCRTRTARRLLRSAFFCRSRCSSSRSYSLRPPVPDASALFLDLVCHPTPQGPLADPQIPRDPHNQLLSFHPNATISEDRATHSVTIRTAPSRNSGSNLRRFSAMTLNFPCSHSSTLRGEGQNPVAGAKPSARRACQTSVGQR
jgi:hypothetical protein